MLFWFTFIILFASLESQSFENYFKLLEEGRLEEVSNQLPELKSKYPKEAAIDYLQILSNQDGDSTIAQLNNFIYRYSKNQYTDDAELKIGEYFYARGLYEQASKQLKRIPQLYPDTNHLQRAIDLLVICFEATGEQDSAQFYVSKTKLKRPDLKVDQYAMTLTPPSVLLKKLAIVENSKPQSKKIKTEKKDWVVQIGAFEKYENAKNLKNKVQSSGFNIEIVEIMSNNKRLHAVRIVRFPTEKEASKVGQLIKEYYELNYKVLNIPE